MTVHELFGLKKRNARGLLFAQLGYYLIASLLIMTYLLVGKLSYVSGDLKGDERLAPQRLITVNEPLDLEENLRKNLNAYLADAAMNHYLSSESFNGNFQILPFSFWQQIAPDSSPLPLGQVDILGPAEPASKSLVFLETGIAASFEIRYFYPAKNCYAIVADEFYLSLQRLDNLQSGSFGNLFYSARLGTIRAFSSASADNSVGINSQMACSLLSDYQSSLLELVAKLNDSALDLFDANEQQILEAIEFYPLDDSLCIAPDGKGSFPCVVLPAKTLARCSAESSRSLLLAKNVNSAQNICQYLSARHLKYEFDYRYSLDRHFLTPELVTGLFVLTFLVLTTILRVGLDPRQKEMDYFLLEKKVKAQPILRLHALISLILLAFFVGLAEAVLLVLRWGFYHLGPLTFLGPLDFVLVAVALLTVSFLDLAHCYLRLHHAE